MTASERLKELILFLDLKSKDLEEKTGIDRDRWNNIRKTTQTAKVRLEEGEALAKLHPEYALWILTGNTALEIGQISPEIERARINLLKAG